MPRLPQKVLNCVFYLYKDRASAKRGDDFGGTGFLIGERSKDPGKFFIHGVTNWHVAVRDGFSVMRLNTRDGGVDIFEFGPEDWAFIPQGDDVAVSPSLPIKSDQHQYSVVFREMFNAPENRKDWSSSQKGHHVGVGDDVVMIGRFVDHDGGETNMPAARFGNISVMPTPIEQPNRITRDTYLVDMHSRTGYSGSPVFVYRTPGNDFEPQSFMIVPSPQDAMKAWFSNGFFMLLGIHCSQFPEEWKIKKKSSSSMQAEETSVTGLSGMTCVVPAESIIVLLESDEIKMTREQGNTEVRVPSKPIAEVAGRIDSKAGDALLREMLSTPPEPHSKAKAKTKSKKQSVRNT